jgi:cold shock CspA family protein
MSIFEPSRHEKHQGNGVPAPRAAEGASEAARRLAEALQRAGFQLDTDPEIARRYKLDMIIHRLQHIHAHINLGVTITTREDDLELQEAFLKATRRNVVHKALYIEIEEDLLDSGAMTVALSTCLSFLFDRRHAQTRAVGVRVHEDSTFQFFDLEENTRRLQRHQHDPAHRVGQEMTGHIIAYFTDKGFGFIEAEKDQKYFFHIANVIDDDLRVQLPSYHPGEDIPVLFKFGGSDGKKYPKALDVVVDQSRYDDDEEYEDIDDDEL